MLPFTCQTPTHVQRESWKSCCIYILCFTYRRITCILAGQPNICFYIWHCNIFFVVFLFSFSSVFSLSLSFPHEFYAQVLQDAHLMCIRVTKPTKLFWCWLDMYHQLHNVALLYSFQFGKSLNSWHVKEWQSGWTYCTHSYITMNLWHSSHDAMTFSNRKLIIDLQTAIPAFFIYTWWEGISITHCGITMPTQVEEPYGRCHLCVCVWITSSSCKVYVLVRWCFDCSVICTEAAALIISMLLYRPLELMLWLF